MKRLIVLALAVSAAAFAVEPIRQGQTVFINSRDGFDVYMTSALLVKKVPLIVVIDREKAEYEITTEAESEKAGWAKVLVSRGMARSREELAIRMVRISSGEVVYGCSYSNNNAFRGKRSAAEACAKNLRKYVTE